MKNITIQKNYFFFQKSQIEPIIPKQTLLSALLKEFLAIFMHTGYMICVSHTAL